MKASLGGLAVVLSLTGALVACAPGAPSQRETLVPLAEVTPPEAPRPPAPVEEEPPVVVRDVERPPREPVELPSPEDLSDDGYVTGGVMGGVPGGVMGGVPGGVVGGVPGGVAGGVVGGVPPVPPPTPKASLVGSSGWNCPFPPEADAGKVDSAVVTLVVTVSASGKALRALVLQDPGSGFGRAARDCALAQKYKPALDDQGKPIEASTPPIKVRFSR